MYNMEVRSMYVNQVEGVQTEQKRPVQTQEVAKSVQKAEATKKQKIEEAAQIELSFQKKTDAVKQENDAKKQQASQERRKEAQEMMRKTLPHSESKYGIHEATNRIMIEIVDKETNELIRECPSKEDLDRLAKTLEIAGCLLDEKM